MHVELVKGWWIVKVEPEGASLDAKLLTYRIGTVFLNILEQREVRAAQISDSAQRAIARYDKAMEIG